MVCLEAAKSAMHIYVYNQLDVYIYIYRMYIFTVWYEDLNNSSMLSSSKFHYLRMRTGSSPLLSLLRLTASDLSFCSTQLGQNQHTRTRALSPRKGIARGGEMAGIFGKIFVGIYVEIKRSDGTLLASQSHKHTHIHTHRSPSGGSGWEELMLPQLRVS